MPKPSQRAEVNNFIQGLITESSPLNYPPNASINEQNFELNRDGTRDRRLGMGYEPSYTLQTAPIPYVQASTAKIRTYKWLSVNGNADDEFLVIQMEQSLLFYNIKSDIISTNGYIGTVTLSAFPVNTLYSFASVEGRLVVAAGIETVAQVVWDGSSFSITYETLKVRDIWGVEVTGIPAYETDSTYRGAYDNKHYYNLQNQSWGIPRKNSSGTLIDPIALYNTDLGKYPSNSELVWAGLQFQPVTAGTTFERVYTNLYDDILGASVIASKGYYVIDLLRRGTSRTTAFAANYAKYPALTVGSISVPNDITTGGASVVTQYAGRIWYAGFNGTVTNGDKRSPNLTNYIAFSRLIKNQTDFYKCYQEGDPSSREKTDLIDTDGGIIRIEGANNIIALLVIEYNLVIIADNGVWLITGGADFGFTPTNYRVSKLSTFGGISPSSVVLEGNRAYYWADSGIFAIGRNQTGDLEVINITQKTIQTLYENIPSTSKLEATGMYDLVSKKVRWIYKEGVKFSSSSETYELILDTVINAFYQHRIEKLDANNVEVVGAFPSTSFKRGEQLSTVYVGTDLVYSNLDVVGISENIRESGLQATKYVALQLDGTTLKYTISYYNDITFRDWADVDTVGKDAKAFVLTGEQTAGDSAIAKQIPYLILYFKRTEDGVTSDYLPYRQSGCLMRCQWDFSDSIVSKKWSPLVQTYRYRRARYVEGLDDTYDTGFDVVSSKNKVRGRGKTFALYLESEPLKDCRILGWSMSVNGNVDV